MVSMECIGYSDIRPARRAFSGIKQQDKLAEIYRIIARIPEIRRFPFCFLVSVGFLLSRNVLFKRDQSWSLYCTLSDQKGNNTRNRLRSRYIENSLAYLLSNKNVDPKKVFLRLNGCPVVYDENMIETGTPSVTLSRLKFPFTGG